MSLDQPAAPGQGTGMPCYLHFLPEVLPAGEELVQCTLSMLHVAAVLSVDQEPEEGGSNIHTHGDRASKTLAAVMSPYGA